MTFSSPNSCPEKLQYDPLSIFPSPRTEWSIGAATEEASLVLQNPVTRFVRSLHQTQTPAEDILWKALRNRKPGFKFVRQKPFTVENYGKKRTFIAVFYSREYGLIVEVDESVHLNRKGYDQLRTDLLEQQYGV